MADELSDEGEWEETCERCDAGTHGNIEDGRCMCCSEKVG